MKTLKPNYLKQIKMNMVLGQICLIFIAGSSFAQAMKDNDVKQKPARITNLEPASEHRITACKAVYRDNNVEIKWSITGINNESETYWIEKSKDKDLFDIVGSGNSPVINHEEFNYTFTDKAPLKGVSYYRILCFENKQIKIVGDVIKVADKEIRMSTMNLGGGHIIAPEKYSPHSLVEESNGYISMR